MTSDNGKEFADHKTIMDRLNNRPRKSLAMKTPNQVLLNFNPPVALAS